MRGAGRLLGTGAPLYLYGAYRREGVETAPSNAALLSPMPSSTGAKPIEVPWPPVIAMLPQITPSIGSTPSPFAMLMPMAFCTTARSVARPQKIATCTLPLRTTSQLAFRPMQVKKPIRSGRFTFFVGADGVVRSRFEAIFTSEELVVALDGLLA